MLVVFFFFWLWCAYEEPNCSRDMTKEELSHHIHILEMKAVQLPWDAFRGWIMGDSVSRVMCNLAQEILIWAEQFTIFLNSWYPLRSLVL